MIVYTSPPYLISVPAYLENTTLSFEYSTDIDAEVINVIDSVKNPSSGVIKAKGIKELILDKDKIDVSKTRIITEAN